MSYQKKIDAIKNWLNTGDFNLTASNDGVYVVEDKNKNNCTLYITEKSDFFNIYFPIVSIADYQDQEAVIKRALGMNLQAENLLGGSLALNAESNEIVICFIREIAKTDSTVFQNILLGCFDLVEHLVSQFKFMEAEETVVRSRLYKEKGQAFGRGQGH